MRAPISVVIPTLDAEASLPRTLASLVEGLEAGLIREVIISDGGSGDRTLEIARAWGCATLTGPPSRGGQLRAGCAQAKGDWLFAVHADCLLPDQWTAGVQAHLAAQKAGWFALAFDDGGWPGRVVAAWANLRSRFGLPYGDQGLLLPRGLYGAAGGYPDIPIMEDVALMRALRGELRPIGGVMITSARKYQAQGWLRRGARNLLTLAGYFIGISPERLAVFYRAGARAGRQSRR